MITFCVVLYGLGFIKVILTKDVRKLPVPHAAVIDDLLNKYVFNHTAGLDDGSVFEYLFGKNFRRAGGSNETLFNNSLNIENTENDSKEANIDLAHLDVSNLDATTLKQIIKTLRSYYFPEEKDSREPYYPSNFGLIKDVIIDSMKQSIYSIRYRMENTKKVRKFYVRDYSFNIGVYRGTLTALRQKMKVILGTLKELTYAKTPFLFYLILYEKLLAFHTDVTYICERMAIIYERFLKFERESAATHTKKQKIKNDTSANNTSHA